MLGILSYQWYRYVYNIYIYLFIYFLPMWYVGDQPRTHPPPFTLFPMGKLRPLCEFSHNEQLSHPLSCSLRGALLYSGTSRYESLYIRKFQDTKGYVKIFLLQDAKKYSGYEKILEIPAHKILKFTNVRTKMADRQGAQSRHLIINQSSKGVFGKVNDSELLDMHRLCLLFVTDLAGDALENCTERSDVLMLAKQK